MGSSAYVHNKKGFKLPKDCKKADIVGAYTTLNFDIKIEGYRGTIKKVSSYGEAENFASGKLLTCRHEHHAPNAGSVKVWVEVKN